MITLQDDFYDDPVTMMHLIEARKAANGERLLPATGGVVQHGLLQGYPLHQQRTWRTSDMASQLLGLYELEVCAVLSHLKARRPWFIDLGAADGYYGLGLVALGHFQRSWLFEIQEASRAALAERAALLDLESQVEIHGDARTDLPALLAKAAIDLSRSIILCDIEGHEFDLFDEAFLALTKQAYIIIENHDFMRPERYAASTALRERAKRYFHLCEIFVGPRDLRRIPLIADHWNDNDRWLLCSEGRAKLASWFILSPLDDDPLTDSAVEEIRADYVRASWP